MAAAADGDHKYADDLPYGAAVGSLRRGLRSSDALYSTRGDGSGHPDEELARGMYGLGQVEHALLSLNTPCRDVGLRWGDSIYNKEMKDIYV